MKRKRPPFKTAFERANKRMYEETKKQTFSLYPAAALALWRCWGKRKKSIESFLAVSHEVWLHCASNNNISMVQICEEETGIEVQNGDGKSWHDLAFLNADYDMDPYHMSNAQWVVMRNNQIRWVRPQLMACLMVSLHRKYGFGYDRLTRIYGQIEEIEREYDCRPDRIKKACMDETGIDISAAVLGGDMDNERNECT